MSTLWPSENLKTIVGLGLILIQFFIPLFILIICYGKIVWVLSRRINKDLIENKSTETDKPNTDTGKDKFELARRNTIKTLLIVGLCFIICWSQNQVIYLLYNCGYYLNLSVVYQQFTVLMVFLNCTVNPFIYLIKYRDYQQALKAFFHCNKYQDDHSCSNSSTMSNTQATRLTDS